MTCYNYQNLGDANIKSSYATPQFGPVFCDDLSPKGWYVLWEQQEQASCFRADSLINRNTRDKIYVSNI